MERDASNAYFTELYRTVSAPRLEAYRSARAVETDLDIAVNYLWNIALSEALYPSLATLEVILRNSVHNTMVDEFGTELWFDWVIKDGQADEYRRTVQRLEAKLGQPPTPGKIVAELNFGFWVSLLTQPYHQTLWARDRTRLLKNVFPNLPPTPNSRRFVHGRINTVRVLRNRVMHHEPIWIGLRSFNKHHDIKSLYHSITEAIGWISKTVRDSMVLCDRFPDVYEASRPKIESDLKEFLRV